MPPLGSAPDRLAGASIRVRGSENEAMYKCLERIVVNEDLERGSSFQVTIGLCRNEDGSWPHLDDPHLEPWNRVTISVAFPGHSDVLMDGYISEVHVSADKRAGSVTMDIRGVDASYVMSLEPKTRVWEDKSYEQIAEQIIVTEHHFRAVLPAAGGSGAGGGGAADSAPPPPVTQRGTDRDFLRELARRRGYEFFVRGADVHFHPTDLSGTPQKLIAVEFGDRTNCDNLKIELDGTRPTEAEMVRHDPETGEERSALASESGLAPLGQTGLAGVRGHGAPQTRLLVRQQGAATAAEQEAYVRAVLQRHGWWIKATGTLDGLRYGRILQSQRLVTIKGLGKPHTGNYYVRRVTHTLGPRTYEMAFEAYRNGLGQLGTEDFTDESPDAVTAPVAAGPGAQPSVSVVPTGNVVLPA